MFINLCFLFSFFFFFLNHSHPSGCEEASPQLSLAYTLQDLYSQGAQLTDGHRGLNILHLPSPIPRKKKKKNSVGKKKFEGNLIIGLISHVSLVLLSEDRE